MKKLIISLLLTFFIFRCDQKPGEKTETEVEEGFTFAFLTDIHLQPELNAIEGFKQAIDTVNKLNPDFVITGGDLVADALGVPFERADALYNLYKEVSAEFKMPVYNTMGNHEVFGLYEDSGIDPSHKEYNENMFENRIGKRYYSFDHKGWHFMVLDGIGTDKGRHYYGGIDDEQIEWIKSELAELDKDTPIVLRTHIPFITAQTQLVRGTLAANGEGSVITNGREVLLLFYEYNLKLVLQGHLHFLEDIYVDNKVHFITGGAVSASWWNGPRGAVEEGFLLLRIKGEEVDWEYVDYGWEAQP
ncbi:metallophosphoesterase family protein [Bacteroidota bacterium]